MCCFSWDLCIRKSSEKFLVTSEKSRRGSKKFRLAWPYQVLRSMSAGSKKFAFRSADFGAKPRRDLTDLLAGPTPTRNHLV